MNKTKFINKLKNETEYTEDTCILINNILEKNCIIGRRNKQKIINELISENFTEDESENVANDKAMHNRGYMKGMDSYRQWQSENTFRNNPNNLRRVLATQYLDPERKYTLRFRQVLDDPECYLSFDYIELCPKSGYGSPEGEDTH